LAGAGAVQKLHRLVSRGKALEWILLGSHVTATEALSHGLVTAVHLAVDLMPAAMELAGRFRLLGPRAVAQSKMAVRMCGDADLSMARNIGLEALAMLIGHSYEDIFAKTVSKSCPTPHLSGMKTRDIVRVAKKFQVVLRLLRTWDLENSTGLLTVERLHKEKDEFEQHLVLLKFGLIFDTDGTVWEPETYFSQHEFRPVSILIEEGE